MRLSAFRHTAAQVAVVALVGAACGSIQARGQNHPEEWRLEQPGANVILEIPAEMKLRTVVGNTLEIRPRFDGRKATEVRMYHGATLSWSNGLRLEVRDSPVAVVKAGEDGPTRILIQSRVYSPKGR